MLKRPQCLQMTFSHISAIFFRYSSFSLVTNFCLFFETNFRSMNLSKRNIIHSEILILAFIKYIENVICKISIKKATMEIFWMLTWLIYFVDLILPWHSNPGFGPPPPITYNLSSIDATPNPCLAGGIAASMVHVLVIELNRIYTQVSMI